MYSSLTRVQLEVQLEFDSNLVTILPVSVASIYCAKPSFTQEGTCGIFFVEFTFANDQIVSCKRSNNVKRLLIYKG